MSFFDELKRRNVFKVTVAYLLVGWLLMQISDVMVPTLHLPEWVQTATAYFLIIGFLPAIIFAWAFEMTPEGLKRESEVVRAELAPHQGGQKLNYVIIGALVVVIGLLLADRFLNKEPETVAPQVADVETVVEDETKSIAVLPFANLSADEENAFFAAGVHEDILTHLSRVADLRVNSRTSVMQYAGTQLNMKDVAEELGARYILEGSVRRSGNRVRVTAQLIDAQSDVHLWAENFDRELTDIFEIQTAVAKEITDALQAELSPVEEKLITGRKTDSIEAYDLFLQARIALQDEEKSSIFFDTAVPLLEQAVNIDPEYAQAWALLAIAHGDLYWFRIDPLPSRLDRMKDAVDQAFALQPDLPEAQLALATYYYRGFYDYANALVQLEQVRKVLPNDTLVHYNLGLTYRRLGEFGQSIESFLRATEIDPLYLAAWAEAAETASSSNNHRMAVSIDKEIAKRFPDSPRMAYQLSMTRLKLFGDVEGAKRILDALPGADHYFFWMGRHMAALWGRDYQAAAMIMLKDSFFETSSPGAGYAEAARALSHGGFEEESSETLKRALEILSVEVNKPYSLNYSWPHALFAVALILDGAPEKALASCDRALGIMNLEMDKIHGPQITTFCIWVEGMAGNTDKALDMMEELLDWGFDMNYWFLSLNPDWDFLRDNERFQQLLAHAKSEMDGMIKEFSKAP